MLVFVSKDKKDLPDERRDILECYGRIVFQHSRKTKGQIRGSHDFLLKDTGSDQCRFKEGAKTRFVDC